MQASELAHAEFPEDFGSLGLSLALRPVGSLNRPRRPLSRGFSPASHPAEPLVSYRTHRHLSGWNLPPLATRAFGRTTTFSRTDGGDIGKKLANPLDGAYLGCVTNSDRFRRTGSPKWVSEVAPRPSGDGLRFLLDDAVAGFCPSAQSPFLCAGSAPEQGFRRLKDGSDWPESCRRRGPIRDTDASERAVNSDETVPRPWSCKRCPDRKSRPPPPRRRRYSE